MNSVPTRDEINPFRDLDGNCAERDLLGKPVEGMLELLHENSLKYQEHFMWMGPRAFIFYFPAATRYLCSDAAAGDLDFVSCMCSNLMFRLTHDWNEIRPSFADIAKFVDAVLAGYASVDSKGEMRGRYRQILEKMNFQPGAASDCVNPPDRNPDGTAESK